MRHAAFGAAQGHERDLVQEHGPVASIIPQRGLAGGALVQGRADPGQAFLVVILGLQEPQVAAAQGGGVVARQLLHRGIGVDDLPLAGAGLANRDAFRGGSRQGLEQAWR